MSWLSRGGRGPSVCQPTKSGLTRQAIGSTTTPCRKAHLAVIRLCGAGNLRRDASRAKWSTKYAAIGSWGQGTALTWPGMSGNGPTPALYQHPQWRGQIARRWSVVGFASLRAPQIARPDFINDARAGGCSSYAQQSWFPACTRDDPARRRRGDTFNADRARWWGRRTTA
jgi:hypothetical protein